MKSIFKFSSLSFLALAVLFTLSSCGGDDEIIIDPGPGPGGITVADGFYMASTSADPTATDVLETEKVEDGYGSKDRDGFIGNFIYVAGGSYNLVEIKSQEITATWGGTTETIDDGASDCGGTSYILAVLTADGAAIDVAAGFYKVSFDSQTKELILHKIETVAIIGSATDLDWAADTPLSGSVTADGGSWSQSNIALNTGDYKYRFNCRWSFSRADSGDGYVALNNIGGAADNLTIGGGDVSVSAADAAIYTITLLWTPEAGFTSVFEKTGDVVSGDFKPEEHVWAILGESLNPNDDDMDGTPDGWQQDDLDLVYTGLTGNIYSWEMESIALVAGKFKFRQNDNWTDPNLGFSDFAEVTGDIDDIEADGGDFRLLADGSYKIVMSTADEGVTYVINFTKL